MMSLGLSRSMVLVHDSILVDYVAQHLPKVLTFSLCPTVFTWLLCIGPHQTLQLITACWFHL